MSSPLKTDEPSVPCRAASCRESARVIHWLMSEATDEQIRQLAEASEGAELSCGISGSAYHMGLRFDCSRSRSDCPRQIVAPVGVGATGQFAAFYTVEDTTY